MSSRNNDNHEIEEPTFTAIDNNADDVKQSEDTTVNGEANPTTDSVE